MSINVACLCKQPLDICPKKVSKHLYTCDKGDSVPFSDVKPPFSPPGQYAATLGHLFALALFVLLKPKDRKYVGPGFYMNQGRERGFRVFYNPHSASVKSFVMNQTKARSWSGMPLSRGHNLHSSRRNILLSDFIC